jgi:hypothetical protein
MPNPRLVRYDDKTPIEVHLLRKLLGAIRRLENGCWVCDAAYQMNQGYTEVKIGRGSKGIFRECVHVLSYKHFHGPIPDGMLVCHSCDFRPCCNPEHLFTGTHLDNQSDMANKDRVAFGSKHYAAKLTEADIVEIYHLGRMGMLHREIAEQFGVSRSRIGTILSGKDWTRLYKQHMDSNRV